MRSRVLGLRTWIVARISSKAHGCIGPLQANAKSPRTPEPYDMGTGQKQWQQHKNKGFGEVRVTSLRPCH